MENVPDNVCGVWIAGFSQREFGRWQFAAKTTSEVEMRREENIEIIEFPCGGPVKPHWGEKVSGQYLLLSLTLTTLGFQHNKHNKHNNNNNNYDYYDDDYYYYHYNYNHYNHYYNYNHHFA